MLYDVRQVKWKNKCNKGFYLLPLIKILTVVIWQILHFNLYSFTLDKWLEVPLIVKKSYRLKKGVKKKKKKETCFGQTIPVLCVGIVFTAVKSQVQTDVLAQV